MSLSKQSWVVIGAVAAVGAAAGIAAAAYWNCKRKRKTRMSSPDEFKMPVAIVEQLWSYPLKSGHRIEEKEIECLARGFKNDRYLFVQ